MLVTWHPKRWRNWFVPEDKKKDVELFLLMKSSIFIYLFLFSLYLTLTFPSLQLKPINVN